MTHEPSIVARERHIGRGPGRARIAIFGTFDSQRHPRVQVLAEGLREHGWAVEVQNVPWRVTTMERLALLRRPWLAAPIISKLIAAWYRLWQVARSAQPVDIVVVGYFGYLDVHLARVIHDGALIVLDDLAPLVGTAEDRGLDGELKLRGLAALESAAVRAADLVIVDTKEHDRPEASCVVVPVGAPSAWFASAPVEAPPSKVLRVVFFGLFTPLQGAVTIARAVQLVAEHIEVTFIGVGQEHGEVIELLRAHPNVRFIDWVDGESLPRTVAEHDVCLGIFGNSSKAHRVVPNKVFQGMAAGCSVITSDTAPQRRLLGNAAILVPPEDPQALAGVLDGLARDRDLLDVWKRRARTWAQKEFISRRVVSDLDAMLRKRLE